LCELRVSAFAHFILQWKALEQWFSNFSARWHPIKVYNFL